MTAFEKYVDALASGETVDDDFPKNESSWEELFDFGKCRIAEIVALRKENTRLQERVTQLEAAQQPLEPTSAICPRCGGPLDMAQFCPECDVI
jgi:hypothetical protein